MDHGDELTDLDLPLVQDLCHANHEGVEAVGHVLEGVEEVNR